VTPPDPETDNPLVLDSVNSPGTRESGDFQLTPSGEFAAFVSTLPLTGYDSTGHSEVYRYDAATEQLDCASCNPASAAASGDSTLASNGLSLTDDGKVFFDSTDALAPRDLDNTEDAYEWEPRGTGNCQPESPNFNKAPDTCLGLISTGSSPFASSLLGASANGTDAYFFTRDTLVPQDKNGSLVKIYDAREGGGFPYEPSSPPCAASDECHGAGSPAPSPPIINTVKGSLGNLNATKCMTGFVEKAGKCVRKPHKPNHRHKRHHKKSAGMAEPAAPRR
jgi:hypothetical protein